MKWYMCTHYNLKVNVHTFPMSTGCPCGQVWGSVKATCENPNVTADNVKGCTCPKGQLYSTTSEKCHTPDKCPRCDAHGAGDPHYTTFDGVHYTLFLSCSHVVAEDCANQTWSVIQVASNNCSGGKAPTCIDESILIVPRLNTALHYNRITNSYWFVGSTPSTDDLIVILNGNGFKAHLLEEDIVVSHWKRTLKVSANIKWAGKICGLLGTCDRNKSNEHVLRDGTVLSDPSNPQFWEEYAVNIDGICNHTNNNPGTNCSELSFSEAKKFCSVMYNSAGPYRDCQSANPAGRMYDDTIDTPFEQCVFDHCQVNEKVACEDILGYADVCSKLGITVGNPPAKCREFLMTFHL